MRPIDADALMDSLEQPFNWTETPEEIQEVVDYERFVDAIIEAPTIEGKPVRHGQWINPHWSNNAHCADCSECGSEAQHLKYRGVQEFYVVCPFCGAKMDGGENCDT